MGVPVTPIFRKYQESVTCIHLPKEPFSSVHQSHSIVFVSIRTLESIVLYLAVSSLLRLVSATKDGKVTIVK